MAKQLGVDRLNRHLFLCLGPNCVAKDQGEKTWDYIKRRLKELGLVAPNGGVYRTNTDHN